MKTIASYETFPSPFTFLSSISVIQSTLFSLLNQFQGLIKERMYPQKLTTFCHLAWKSLHVHQLFLPKGYVTTDKGFLLQIFKHFPHRFDPVAIIKFFVAILRYNPRV